MKLLIVALLCSLLCTSVLSVAAGPFELDGNAGSNGKDDWATLYNGGGSALLHSYSGITTDPAGKSYYTTGGSKDTNDVTSWKWTDSSGGVPDKNDLLHSYAASYVDGDDVYLFFGSDRFDTSGDSAVGFWFFKDNVQQKSDGSFIGQHRNGDLLVVGNFGSSQEIVIYQWLNGALSLLYTNLNAKCDPAKVQTACAITNTVNTPSPWPYTNKAGQSGTFYPGAFLEGGLLLTDFFTKTDIPCFSSFFAVTRSSSSDTAQLKDFIVNEFKLCGIDLNVTCLGSEINAAKTGITYHYEVVSENTGFGNLFNVQTTFRGQVLGTTPTLGAGLQDVYTPDVNGLDTQPTGTASVIAYPVSGSTAGALTDSQGLPSCPPPRLATSVNPLISCMNLTLDEVNEKFIYGYCGSVENTGFGTQTIVSVTVTSGAYTNTHSSLVGVVLNPVAPGTTANFCGYFTTTTQLTTLSLTVVHNNFKAVSANTGATSNVCPGITRTPSVNVTKDCSTYLEQSNGKLVVKVDVDVRVCNDGDVKLKDYTVVEDFGTPSTADDATNTYGALYANTCANYSYSYYPGTDTVNHSFSDTVTVTAHSILGFGNASDSDSATCGLCE